MLGKLLMTTAVVLAAIHESSADNRGCVVDKADRRDCGWGGMKPDECTNMGCCWDITPNAPYCYYREDRGCAIDKADRTDCGWGGMAPNECLDLGCCWEVTPNAPYCYYKKVCVTTSTGTKYRYNWNLPRLEFTRFTFHVQASKDAYVALSSQNRDLDEMYEIVIGAENNTKCVIRRSKNGPNRAEWQTPGILSPTEYKTLSIQWYPDGAITVWWELDNAPFFQWTDPDPLPIAYAGYTTDLGSTGDWRFCSAGSPADIVFVLDVSSSIPRPQLDLARDFMRDFIECEALQRHSISIGVILYNCVPRTYLTLAQYALDDPQLIDKIDQIIYEGGESRTGVAIRHMRATSDFRDGVSGVAVIFTDGQTSDDSAYEAGVARAAGINLYAVGVGIPALVDQAALESITDDSDRVFDTTQACVAAQKIMDDLSG